MGDKPLIITAAPPLTLALEQVAMLEQKIAALEKELRELQGNFDTIVEESDSCAKELEIVSGDLAQVAEENQRLREGIAQEVAWLSDKILTSYCVSSLHNLRALLDKNTDTSE